MTIREFVADTLNQITAGVADARAKNQSVAPSVAPVDKGDGYRVWWGGVTNPAAFLIEFDVAVTVSKKTETGAKGGLAVHIFEAGAERASTAEHSTVSRIKFEVPVTYENVA